MTLPQCIRAALAIGATATAFSAMPAQAAGTVALPPTTPDGITLIEVSRELPISQPIVLWLRPGDAEGRTLFVSDKDTAGVSKCEGDCAKEFMPLAAPASAKSNGDWSIIRRKDAARQWAYQGHALYTWSKEQTPGEVATNVGLAETANSKFAEDPVKAGSLMPPAGWQVARLTPAKSLMLPDSIDARMVTTAEAVVLTDFNGLTLYSFAGDPKQDAGACVLGQCETRWLPLAAPEMASPVGDFSLMTRADGMKQWAYKKRALYLFKGDKLPGDVNGIGVDPRWTAAALSEDFRPANVSVNNLDGYGNVLSLNGYTLYGGYQFEKRWGGRNLRDTFTNIYLKGKRLGSSACDDEECLKTWHPFAAPADAVANGFWEPITRSDGSKQWTYKGYALYSYAKEDAPKEHYAQATYTFSKLDGTEAEYKRAAFLEEIGKTSGGAGIYWSIARP
jgi:predicted lipoprotein with Yx(FWY)xxD motif